jgi:hypothetical protein
MSANFRWQGGPDDGVLFSDSYKNWNVGEPNNGLTGEDCVVMTNTGQWNDVLCSTARCFILEYECPVGMIFGPTACMGLLL